MALSSQTICSFTKIVTTWFTSILIVMLLASPWTHARQWTDSSGQTIEADFVRSSGNNITLKVGSKLISVSKDKLSEPDQTWVETYLATKKARTWKEKDGTRHNAKYVQIDGNDVVLTASTGEVRIAWQDLEPQHRSLIRDIVQIQQTGDTLPDAVRAKTEAVPEQTIEDAFEPAENVTEANHHFTRQEIQVLEQALASLMHDAASATWTNREGKEIIADYIKTDRTKVVLEMNGNPVSVEISKLCDSDQLRIESLSKFQRFIEHAKMAFRAHEPVNLPEGIELSTSGNNGYLTLTQSGRKGNSSLHITSSFSTNNQETNPVARTSQNTQLAEMRERLQREHEERAADMMKGRNHPFKSSFPTHSSANDTQVSIPKSGGFAKPRVVDVPGLESEDDHFVTAKISSPRMNSPIPKPTPRPSSSSQRNKSTAYVWTCGSCGHVNHSELKVGAKCSGCRVTINTVQDENGKVIDQSAELTGRQWGRLIRIGIFVIIGVGGLLAKAFS